MKIVKFTCAMLLLAVALNGCMSGGTAETQSAGEIEWVMSLGEGLSAAKAEKKNLMVDFYADWCGWCKKLDRDVYSNPEVAKLAENFVCVKVNTDRYPVDAQQYGVQGLPTVMFMDSSGKVLEKVVGYRDAKYFASVMGRLK
ncbi:MAG: thioredoxin family protein [Endomicrobiales bacterium]|nr:thioredoxin family protein [Endomicrobiales bacterium]